MKYYQIAIIKEGTLWIPAESPDAALDQARSWYGIEDVDGYTTSYELTGKDDD